MTPPAGRRACRALPWLQIAATSHEGASGSLVAQMETESSPPNPLKIIWHTIRAWLIGMAFVAALTATLIVPISPLGKVAIESGDVAPRDIRSPIRTPLESAIRTEAG